MFNQDPHAKFQEDLAEFNFGAALRTFVSDNITLCLLILAVCGISAVANGAKGVLTHRRVGTILLVIMVCRAFHAGATANRRIIMKDVTPEKENDSEQDS
ncbi:hypothetical protein DRD23_08575 [Salmonella enterica subsp. enterica serovar Enteritidis]|nr:hypothetical protein [Salmonella enterica subsp. enterica serovar Enteritidis]